MNTVYFFLTTYLPKRGRVDLVLGILPTGLHINLIHEAARHTVPFANAEIVHQPVDKDEEEEIGVCFSRTGHFDQDQQSDTSVGSN